MAPFAEYSKQSDRNVGKRTRAGSEPELRKATVRALPALGGRLISRCGQTAMLPCGLPVGAIIRRTLVRNHVGIVRSQRLDELAVDWYATTPSLRDAHEYVPIDQALPTGYYLGQRVREIGTGLEATIAGANYCYQCSCGWDFRLEDSDGVVLDGECVGSYDTIDPLIGLAAGLTSSLLVSAQPDWGRLGLAEDDDEDDSLF